jgi:hypothetical protein
MTANAVVLALVLAQSAPQGMPPAPDDNGYPPGLFEHSPVIDEPVKANPQGQKGPKKHHSSEGFCHHYSEWRYNYPQPC